MRNIPIALAAHLATARTSLCFLIKIVCKDGTILAFTTADVTITYDDGPGGPIDYLPNNGVTPSEQVWSASLAVDTADIVGVVRDTGITEEQIRAGLFDHGRFWVYRVNYLDLSQGHYIYSSGTTGETKFTNNSFSVELRSKSQALKQPINEAYLLTCTVAYGSPPCGKTLEWVDFEVDTVDPEEPDRILTIMGTGLLDSPAYQYGVLRMLTGDNAGAEVEVELHDGDDIHLLLPLPYALSPGDLGEIRIDCIKEARDVVHGCKSPLRWGDEWSLHHRGFPDIPVADQGSLLAPGAQTPSVPGSGPVTSMDIE